jgi:hypothetical protein
LKLTLAALALWAISAGVVWADDCPCPGSAASLAVPPEDWPPPCHGPACDTCNDPLRTACPNKDDFFLVPPRLRLYVVADGAAFCLQPQEYTDVASLNGPGNIVLSTRDFNKDFAFAGRTLVGCTLNDCIQIEGVYTGVTQASDTASVRDISRNGVGAQGGLFSPFGGFGAAPLPNLDYNNLAQIHYSANFQSIELNVRRQIPMPPERLAVSFLFGVRYISQPSDLDYFTQSDVSFSQVGTPVLGSTVTNSVRVSTENQMVGPQIGGLFELYVDNRWWINFEIKAAVLNDRARLSTSYTNTISAPGGLNAQGHTFFNDEENHTAFAGSMDLTFVYRWSPRCSTRLGYQATFLQDIALAADNFPANINVLTQGPAELNHKTGAILHGPYAGVMFGW